MTKLIAYYELNKTKYYISQINNQKIIFLKSDKSNNFSTNLTNNEQKIMKKIYNSLKPDLTKSIYIKDLKVNNNDYKLYLDKTNNNYFWIPTKGIYNEQDNIHLNYKYNHQPIIIYTNNHQSNLNQSKSSKFYNKLIKLGSKIIPVFLSTTICLTLLNGCTVVKQENINFQSTSITETVEYKEETLETIITEIENEPETKKQYNYEEIKQAITDNPYLSSEEKEFLYKLKFLFDENSEFMNLDLVINNLRNLKIEYNFNIGGGEAAYHTIENKILIESSDFQSTKKAHFIHEFLHSLQGVPIDFIGELSTEFFTKETMVRLYKEGLVEKEFFLPAYAKIDYQNGELKFNNEEEWTNYLYRNKRFSSGYEGYSNLYTLLAEIIPTDALRQYQFNPENYQPIIDELIKIDNEYNQNESKELKEQRAYLLIDSLNDLRVYSYEINGYIYNKNATEYCQQLNYYYKIKKGLSLNEEPLSSLYLQYAGRLEFNFENKIMDYMKEKHNLESANTLITKTYLSNAEESTILTNYEPNKQNIIIEINQDIEAAYSEYLHPLEHVRGYTK